MTGLLRPCVECGELSANSRCPLHPGSSEKTPSASARGYDAAWRRLSAKARRAQPFCADCGSTEDLTTDHSPEAWARKARGLAVRLADVEVVCRPCNSRRGAARGGGVTHKKSPGDPGVSRTLPLKAPLAAAEGPGSVRVQGETPTACETTVEGCGTPLPGEVLR